MSNAAARATAASCESEGRNPVDHRIDLFKAKKDFRLLKLLGSLRIHKTGKLVMFGGPFSFDFKAAETQESRIVRLLLAMMVKIVKRL